MKIKSTHSILLTSALLGLLAAPAHAAITYVDASSGALGNTRDSTKLQSDTSWVFTGTAQNSTQWGARTEGTNGNLFQALPVNTTDTGNASNIPQLTTTISGLTDGNTYNVWVFFQDNVGDAEAGGIQNWVISAGLTTSLDKTYWAPNQPLATHNSATPVLGTGGTGTITTVGVQEATTLTFAGTGPNLVEGTGVGERRLYGVNLGPITLSGETTIDVYVAMLIAGNSNTTRIFYDGVGFEAIPEPSAVLLGGLGLLALLRRRRN